MDYRTLARFRDRAKAARQAREKVMLTPDEVDALLDIACDWYEDGEDG